MSDVGDRIVSLKRGARGARVKKLQEALLALGRPLPRWGADGDLGEETLGELAALLEAHGKKFDDDKSTVSDAELAFVDELLKARVKPVVMPSDFHDLRLEHPGKHRRARRAWTKVTGITLHQTATVFGERPLRYKDVGCHVAISRAGKVMWLSDFDWVVIHGHGLNGNDVGIEMDGHYAGVEGNLKTYWRPKEKPDRMPLSPTPEMVEAAHEAIHWICGEVARRGGAIRHLHAHRQASDTRQSDPGSALWQAVALPLMAELGLSDGGRGWKRGSGLAIPEAWDARYGGVKY